MSLATTPQCVAAVGCELGEGPVWRAADQALWFVDIKRCAVHRFAAATGVVDSWPAPAPPGFIAPLDDGGWIAGLKTGLHRFDPASGAFTLLLAHEPGIPGNRINDGFVDAKGRLWFGTMDDGEAQASGALYRLDARGLVRCDPDYVITNGPAVSPDGATLYHTDTLQRTIYAFDLDADGGLARKRVFATIPDGAGYPDGLAVDAEGHVWTGLFAGHAARRYAPDGTLAGVVAFPCANITKLAFGGDDLRTVYATTARKGLSPRDLEDQPLAGGLFSFRVELPGLPQNTVGAFTPAPAGA